MRDALIAGDYQKLTLVLNPETYDFLLQMLQNSEPDDQQAVTSSLAKALEAPYDEQRSLIALRLWQSMHDLAHLSLLPMPLPQPDSVQLEGAELAESRFTGLQLRNLNLRNANLRETEWRNNRIQGGDFYGALMNQSRWADNNLQLVDFSNASTISSFWVRNTLDKPIIRVHDAIDAGGGDFAASRWVAAGRPHATPMIDQPALKGHRSTVTAVAFSPDGEYFISGSRDTRSSCGTGRATACEPTGICHMMRRPYLNTVKMGSTN